MNDLFKEKPLLKEYKFYLESFLRLSVLIPIVLVLLFAAINFFYKGEHKEILQLILEALVVVFSGFAGTQFMNYLNKKSAKSELKLKATGAIRNLINIEERLKNIIGRIKVDSDIGEIRNLVVILQADVNTAKDDWNDVIDISEVDNYRKKMIKAEQEKEELLKKNDESKSENSNLTEELEKKDKEIEKIQEDFDNYKSENNLGALGDVSVSPSLSPTVNASYSLGQYVCEKCHKQYYPTTVSLPITGKQNFMCEECKVQEEILGSSQRH